MIINPVYCPVEAFHNLCCIMCFEHTNPVSGVWAVVMRRMIWINRHISFIIYIVLCVWSTQTLWVESEQWSWDWCDGSKNTSLKSSSKLDTSAWCPTPHVNPRHYHKVFWNSMAILDTLKSPLGLLAAPCRKAPDKLIDGHEWLTIWQESHLQLRRTGVNPYQFLS